MRSNLNKIEKKFLRRALNRPQSGTLIFPKTVALEFVNECQNKKIPLLGIDGFLVGHDIKPITGFEITDTSLQPQQEYSVDFAQDPYNYTLFDTTQVYSKVLETIEKGPDNIHYEIVCGERNGD